MVYTPTVWRNGQSPAINAPNLNKIEQGIKSSFDENPLSREKSTYPYERFIGFSRTNRRDLCKVPGREHYFTASGATDSVYMLNADTNEEPSVNFPNYMVSVCYLPNISRLVGFRYYSNSGLWVVYGSYSNGKISNVIEIENAGITAGNEQTRAFNYDGTNLGIYTRSYAASSGYTHAISYRDYNGTSAPTTVFTFTEANSYLIYSVFKNGSNFYFLLDNGELRKYNSSGVLQGVRFLNKTIVGNPTGVEYADDKLYVLGNNQNIGVTTLPF